MDDTDGAVGRLIATWAKLNALTDPQTPVTQPEAPEKSNENQEGPWKLRWKLLVILTDTVLGLFPEAVLGVAGVACTAAGAIYLGQKWGWAMNSNGVGEAQKAIAENTGSSSDPKKSDINWLTLYVMYSVGVIVLLALMYLIFLLPDNERPDRLVKKLQMGGGNKSSIPSYALLIVGMSILGVLSSILTESTLRKTDPATFHMTETEIPATNRRLLFLHGVAGLATAFAILFVVYPSAWNAKYGESDAYSLKRNK